MRTLGPVVSLAVAGLIFAESPSAESLYRQAKRAEQHGRMTEAYLLYSEAAALARDKPTYWLHSQAVRTRAALEAVRRAQAKTPPAGPPGDNDASEPETGLEAATGPAPRQPQPPPELHGSSGRKDFDLRGDSKALFEQIAAAFGLDAVFDGEYQPGRPIRFQVEQLDWREALRLLQAATDSFLVPLSDRLFLVAKDTDQRRRQVEPTLAVTVPVPQAVTTQELVEMAQAVRQLFTLEHVAWDAEHNLVVLRDRASRVIPARQLFEELLYHRPQAEIEVELMQVDRKDMLRYGLQLPTRFPLAYLGTFWGVAPSIPSTVARLATFGGGKSLFGVGIADAQVFASMSKSNARSLLRSVLRSVDGQPVAFHAGQRYPILTAGYFGPASFTKGQQAYTPPPSFTFEDLGIVVKVTPHIHGDDDMTLELDTEFKVLAGSSLNGIPVIANRKLEGKVRLRNGQYGFVAGLMSASDARVIEGIAGLSGLPALGPLFKHATDEKDTSEVLIVVKPRLLSPSPAGSVNAAIPVGTETRPYLPL